MNFLMPPPPAGHQESQQLTTATTATTTNPVNTKPEACPAGWVKWCLGRVYTTLDFCPISDMSHVTGLFCYTGSGSPPCIYALLLRHFFPQLKKQTNSCKKRGRGWLNPKFWINCLPKFLTGPCERLLLAANHCGNQGSYLLTNYNKSNI